eukprot:CAMPEP_0181331800 /NCGR_PEP_ID=MMETSP1101-20121128/24721_1 /TAXON_ID=46948 /ORGANISM="Rhodomonas abbreviata, Strain Caron Lab Isolate" /LENGTH=82 /DNA_ID=CAMNT_0023441337 /DNA_START=249 /DNA_END=494 /DNA_ORIENTATION=-
MTKLLFTPADGAVLAVFVPNKVHFVVLVEVVVRPCALENDGVLLVIGVASRTFLAAEMARDRHVVWLIGRCLLLRDCENGSV